MTRATWKGFISFGLVNIPVALYSAEKRADLQFDLLDSRDNAKIRYQRVNEETGEEVPWDQIVRAYEYQNGNYVLVGEEDFARAAVESTKTIAVDTFVEQQAIRPYFYEKPYIAVPDKGGEKAYVLLREALQQTNRVGIAKVVIRGRQYLVAVMVENNAIMVNRMRFSQELIDPASLDLPSGRLREYNISAQELDTAEQLVMAMAGEWRPDNYRDDYRDALLNWIGKKARVGEVVPEEEVQPETAQAQPINIMDLLDRSLQEARSR